MSLSNDRIHLGGHVTASSVSVERVNDWQAWVYHQNHDAYWKARTSDGLSTLKIKAVLEKRGYATGGCVSRAWLRESFIRCELGQTSYVNCSNDDLRSFVRARGIDCQNVITKQKKGTRAELVKLLDHADQNPRFSKFANLPPEIRNRIYAMYFAEVSDLLHTPMQPPLALVSRQIRKETLQMFYSSFHFGIAFTHHVQRHHVREGTVAVLRIPTKTLLWFSSLSSTSLSALRRLRLGVYTGNHATYERIGARTSFDPNEHYRDLMWFDLEFVCEKQVREWRVYFAEGPLASTNRFWQSCVSVAWIRVASVVRSINTRTQGPHLTVDDLKALRKAMEFTPRQAQALGLR